MEDIETREINEENMDTKQKVKLKIDLDTILEEEIGQFGRYQLRTFGLIGVLVIIIAWSSVEYMFTTARINTRCFIPECEKSVDNTEFTPEWLLKAVPGTSQTSFDNCQRFGNASTPQQVSNDTCPATLFDRDTLQPCDHFVYQNTHSVVYDLGLACDEWRRSLIGTVRTFGQLVSLPLTGFISDRYGRRFSLVFNTFNSAWMGVTRYWADTYIGFIISEFAEATFGGGYTGCYILVMELVGPKYREIAGAAVISCFAIGQVTMGLIAWHMPYWRNLTLTIYIPQFIGIFYIWLVGESVRWLMSQSRFEESETILKKVAKVNKKQLSDKSLKALRLSAEEKIRETETRQRSNEPWLIVQVFQHKRVLLRCVVSPVWWITTTMIYYGLSINAVNMTGNKYLNYIAVTAVEIPGFWTACYLMGKIGRKPVLIGAFWTCALCQVTYIFIPSNLFAVSLTVYMISKFAIAGVATSIYLYTSELYPTKHRHVLFAYSSMIGRIGSMVAPLTPAFAAQWFKELPFALFASFAFVSGLLIFLTPETHGTTLPDTLEQAEQIGLNKRGTTKLN